MTLQETRRTGRRPAGEGGRSSRTTAQPQQRSPRSSGGSRRAAPVIEATEEQPLGDLGGRVRRGIAGWLRSPALDVTALAVIGALLIGIGLVMVLSSSAVTSINGGESGYAGLWRQGGFAAGGLLLLVIAAIVPPNWYLRCAWPLLILGLILQLLVFVPGLGVSVLGNRNWISIAGQTLQPSELLKLALAVWLGRVLSLRQRSLNRPLQLVPAAIGIIAAVGLVVLGHDLGTAMIMCMLAAGALWVAGVPRRWFAGAAAVGGIAVLGLALTSANRMARIGNWIHGQCEGTSCWQSQHGLMALAEGGWWGVGLGESRQKWGLLPAADNDYIFAIIGEELGLWGTLGVLLLFALLALTMFRMIARADSVFIQITVGGVAAWLLGQAFTNMMVVVGLLPVLGVPLPFISSGGSALIASMLALGMLLSFARFEPGARDALRARISRVRRGATVVAAPRGAAAPAPGRRTRAAASRRTASRAARSRAGARSTGGSPSPRGSRSSRRSAPRRANGAQR